MARTGKIHAARRLTPRLKRVLYELQLAGAAGLTTRGIVLRADVCAVNSIISELRTQGYKIECEMEKAGRFRYRLQGGRS